jgi:hypothetical protein
MIRPLAARPAPGTTELLEVLDRVFGGGIVIDAAWGRGSAAPSASAGPAQVVVAALQTYLEHPDPGLSRPSWAPRPTQPRDHRDTGRLE